MFNKWGRKLYREISEEEARALAAKEPKFDAAKLLRGIEPAPVQAGEPPKPAEVKVAPVAEIKALAGAVGEPVAVKSAEKPLPLGFNPAEAHPMPDLGGYARRFGHKSKRLAA